MNNKPAFFLLLVILSVSVVSPALGQDVEKQPDEKKEPQDPAAQIAAPDDDPPENNPLELLKQLVDRMQKVRRSLADKSVTDSTARDQQRIVKDIDRLIQLAKQQQNQNQNSSNNQNQNQSRRETQPTDSDPSEGSPNSEQSPQENAQQNAGENQPSTNRTDSGNQNPDGGITDSAAAKAELARRKAVLRQQWGHLPIRLRERIMNLADEKYLPGYEDRIRRYYQSLAEKTRSAKVKPKKPDENSDLKR